jgi:hypothetical protein
LAAKFQPGQDGTKIKTAYSDATPLRKSEKRLPEQAAAAKFRKKSLDNEKKKKQILGQRKGEDSMTYIRLSAGDEKIDRTIGRDSCILQNRSLCALN